MAFKRAERKRSKARIGICGPAGSGKTMSALKLAFGIVGPDGKIAVIDSENGSASLYAHLGPYDVLEIKPPFTVKKYNEGIRLAEKEGYELIIIDSISHAWAGTGGILDKVDNIASGSKGNKFAAWREATPEHNSLVDAMLQSPLHVIATMRSKTEYVLEEDEKGKKVPKKVGMAPVQREGMDYEFTLVFDVDQVKHVATSSKDRTEIFDGFMGKLAEEHGKAIRAWLETGVEAPAPAAQPALTQGATPLFVTDEQLSTLEDLIRETSTNKSGFLQYLKLESLDKLPAARYQEAVKALEKKKQQTTAETQGSSAGVSAPQGNGISETLKARNIPFEMVNGEVCAKPEFSDVGARDFLKAQGFKWDAKGKAWKLAA